MRNSAANLRALIEPGVGALGFELIEAEISGSGNQTRLRVYIDSPGGVSVDDCAQVSRQLSAVLDVEDPIPGQYTLEVSSPGLDRPLTRRRDFERFAGSDIKLKLLQPVAGRRNFTGRLKGLRGDRVLLEVDGAEREFALEDIERARLVPEV